MIKPNTALSLLLCLAFLLVPARPADAQLSVKQQVADELFRTSYTFMRYTRVTESEAPIALADALMEAALELDPENSQGWATRVGRVQRFEDDAPYEQALQGYLGTGIDDDYARYFLIFQRNAKLPTLDARLGALEDLLTGPEGRAMSKPLRSRVAMLATGIAKEMLNEPARRKWAVEAARSDPANYAAAAEMFLLVQELGGDDVRLGTAAINMVRANPASPVPRLFLARLLTNQAAYDRATQQYGVVASVLDPSGLQAEDFANWGLALMATGQDAAALQLVSGFERRTHMMLRAQAAAEGIDPVNMPTEGPLLPQYMPLTLEILRLSVLDKPDDREAAAASLIRTRLIYSWIKSETLDAENPKDKDLAKRLDAEFALVAAVFGPDLEQAQRLAEEMDENQPLRKVAQGWVALRSGDRAAAAELLGPLKDAEPLAACAMCLIDGQDDAGRARLLGSFMQSDTNYFSKVAAARAMARLDAKPTASEGGKALIEKMGLYPEALWLVDVERMPWLEVRMKISPQRIRPLEPITAQVTVWNTTRFPLAISPEGPIQPMAYVMITAKSSGLPMRPIEPVAVDLGRQFTLGAGERLVFDVRLDYEDFGLMRSTNPGMAFIVDTRLIVNPYQNAAGSVLANGIGGVADVRNILVQAVKAREQDIPVWLESLNDADVTKRLEAMSRLAALDKKLQPELVGPALLDRIQPRLVEIWKNGSDADRAWLILNARDLTRENTSYPELYDLATSSDSKLVWLALLARHVSGADSKVLKAAVERQDLTDVARFAERQRRLIREFEEFALEQERLRDEKELFQPLTPEGGADQP